MLAGATYLRVAVFVRACASAMRVEGGRCNVHTDGRWRLNGKQVGVDGVGGRVGG